MTEPSNRQENFYNICKECELSCCINANPPISPQRRGWIELQLANHPIEGLPDPLFSMTFNKEGYYTHIFSDDEGYCGCYDRDTKLCRIHGIKGENCNAGPVTFDINRDTGKLEFWLKKEALCPLAGKMWNSEEGRTMFAKHLRDAKGEIRQLVKDLEPEALRAILTIGEDETFKIDEEDADPSVLEKLTE